MSKIVAFMFGAFLMIALIGFGVLLCIHISRVVFAKDSILRFGELMQLALWWLAFLNAEGRERICTIVFNRTKRK